MLYFNRLNRFNRLIVRHNRFKNQASIYLWIDFFNFFKIKQNCFLYMAPLPILLAFNRETNGRKYISIFRISREPRDLKKYLTHVIHRIKNSKNINVSLIIFSKKYKIKRPNIYQYTILSKWPSSQRKTIILSKMKV